MLRVLIVVCCAVLISSCDSVPARVGSLQGVLSAEVDYSAQRQLALERALTVDPASGETVFIGETHYVILSDFQFNPNTIRLKSGTITRIRLSNSAWVTHYFGGEAFFRKGAELVDIQDAQAPSGQYHIPVAPFTERDLYLFIKAPGEYALSCFVPIHSKAGMRGVLIVE